jgi:phosphatidylglycerol lysyltransferase
MSYSHRMFKVRRKFLLDVSVNLVGLHGIFILVHSILMLLAVRRGAPHLANVIYIDVLAGLSLVYLWSLLRRYKRNAWLVTINVYVFLLGFHLSALLPQHSMTANWGLEVIEQLALPLAVLGPLVYFRKSFTVRSDTRSFAQAVRVSLILLLITFAYGVIGFSVLDNSDFHEEISLPAATQRTIDQFDLTTSHPLSPHTRRATLFMGSLSVISTGAVIFVFISFFQPLRARHVDIRQAREHAERLLKEYSNDSEDYFKLWPQDKSYIFSSDQQAAIAYRVERGVALVVGDPFGEQSSMLSLLKDFEELCYTNDWQPAFVHSQPAWQKLYAQRGYTAQVIGQEAEVDIDVFMNGVRRDKYFRNINNRFVKAGYTTELLQPPHNDALLQRLRVISDDWLERPGRTERGFMMGHASDGYLQQCTVVVARDSAGTIQGFLNQVPTYEPKVANYDLLRSASTAQSNINDYVLLSFIDSLHARGYTQINLGLSPLAGIDESNDNSLISTAMRLIYKGGDRFYSFQGLRKFKAKYDPIWSDRYVVYKNGVPGFTRTVRALTRAMSRLS